MSAETQYDGPERPAETSASELQDNMEQLKRRMAGFDQALEELRRELRGLERRVDEIAEGLEGIDEWEQR